MGNVGRVSSPIGTMSKLGRLRDVVDALRPRSHPTPPTNAAAVEEGFLRLGRHSYSNANPRLRLFVLHHADWITTSLVHLRLGVERPEIDHPFSKRDVTIGTGAVIGAEALITESVEPYTIVGGNPAKMIGHRFEPDERAALLDSAWWTLDDERLGHLVPVLQSGRVDDFLSACAVSAADSRST